MKNVTQGEEIMLMECSNSLGSKASPFLLGLALSLCTVPAFAVHDEDMELDHGPNGANIVEDAADPAPVDWDKLFYVNGTSTPKSKEDAGQPMPSNFGPATFIRDFIPVSEGRGPDPSAFTSGSADTNDISSWSCTAKNNLGAKFNILNAYATAYVNAADETILYFALEREGNEGTAAAGFWFLKDGSVACADTDGGQAEPFTGTHQIGDLLFIADFTAGGKVSDVLVYKWVGSGGSDGSLDLILHPVDADCADAGVNDSACATVNQTKLFGFGPGTDIPWLTESKQPGNTPSNDLDKLLFMEGGINLTANNLNDCFATYLATTRSSTSLTSEKHDFASGSFPLCKVELSKLCSTQGGYNPTTGNIEIPYSVTVKNTGSTTVDNIVATDNECGFGSTMLYFGPISAGNEQTLPGLCSIPLGTNLSGGVYNGVSATASAGVSVVLADSCVARDGDGDGQLDVGICYSPCDVRADPAIAATKSCVTALLAEDNVVKVKVDFSGSVSNTSDSPHCQMDNTCVSPQGQACASDADCGAEPIPLNNVIAGDNKAGALTLLDAPGGSPLATPVTLEPGETAYFEGSYLPDGSGAGYSECPSDASFDDTVTVEGTDAAFGATVQDSAMANCKLCPPGGCPN